MWYDGKADTVFSGGGWSYYSSPDYSLWSFQPDGEGGASWHEPSGNAQEYTPTFGSAFTANNDTFYSLGGANSNDVPTTVVGLATFAFDTDSWNTESSAGASQSSNSVFAEAVFMPNFGERGLIAFLGGESPRNSTYAYETGTDMVDMSNITIYDTRTQAWYHQTATGDIPPIRSEFCAVGNAPSDNATFEIFVYGGSTNSTLDDTLPTDTGYTDVYVLSFPSFTWFKTNAASDTRRSNHFCQILSNSNMLVVGGRNPADDIAGGFGGTDPWTRGMNVFDMVSWTWTSAYDHTAVYTRPQAIQQYYDSNPAKVTWSDPTLASLFAAPSASSSAPTSSSSSGSSSATQTGSATGTPKPASSHTGAIVGGVVGGVAVIACIVGIIIFCIARKRKQPRSPLPVEVPDAPAPAHPKQPVYEAPQYSPEKRVHELDTPPRQTSPRPVELSAEGRHI